jgi:DHA1 family bicyclomycin/chloramphenicol resistance-like MFS transporter
MNTTVEIVATKAVQAEASHHGWSVLAILSLLMGFASISTDLYLPAMPTMATALGAKSGMLEWTISGYLIGFCIGQLFWGPVGDRYGRRIPVAIGVTLFMIGSAGCALSGSAGAIIAWRVVQALGACAGVVLSRAMVRDLYAGARAAQMLSTLITVMAIAPLLGPVVGGQILSLAGWRSIFWTLVAIGDATLVGLITLPETLPARHRNHEPLSHAFANYAVLLKNRKFLAYTGAGAFFYAGVFAYIAGTPFAYINYYHVPPQWYGFLFGAGIIGVMLTNTLNSRLVIKTGIFKMLVYGAVILAATGIILALCAWTGWGGLMGLAIPLFFFVSMNGLVVANSITGALAHYPERAGAASALVGALQYGSGIASTVLVGFFADGTPRPMATIIATTGILSFLCAISVTNNPERTK